MKKGSLFSHRIDFWLGIPLLWAFCLFKTQYSFPKKPPARILLINPASLGDTLLLSVLSQGLKQAFPLAEIVYLAGDENGKLAGWLLGVDRVEIFHLFDLIQLIWFRLRGLSKAAITKFWWQGDYDWVIDASPWTRITALTTLYVRAAWKLGYQTPGQHKHYGFDHIVPHSSSQHEVDNIYSLLQACLVGHPDLALSDLALETLPGGRLAEKIVSGTSAIVKPQLKPEYLTPAWPLKELTPASRFVIFHPWPSGVRAELKEWPIQYWVELGQRFEESIVIVISGGPADVQKSRALATLIQQAGKSVVNCAGSLSLLEWLPVIHAALLTITVNTGFMHWATMESLSMLALHGPTDPKRWGPLSPHATVIQPLQGPGVFELRF